MKVETIELRIAALENAAEFIRGHGETGLTDEDVGGDIDVYVKQCNYVHDFLMAKADKLRPLLVTKP